MPNEVHLTNQPDSRSGLPVSPNSTSWGRLLARLERHWSAVAYGIIVISSLFLVTTLDGGMQGDVSLYKGVVNDFLAGKMPYRDRVLEYPPYVIPIFVLPRIFGEENYLTSFMFFAMLADLAIKLLLVVLGAKYVKGLRALLPVLLYCAGIPFMRYFYLQRYDVFPALICLLAVWSFCSGRHFLSGLAVAVGIGVKVYPAVFVPSLFILAVRQGKWRKFIAGLTVGLLPIVVLSFFLPWWRFAQFQGGRGLQVESLYATLLWLGERLGLANVDWAWARSWFEIHGPPAAAVLPWARGLFMVTVIFSAAVSTWAAGRCHMPSPSELARLLLVPLLGFVVFNVVLSPQYLIWILALAALASLEGEYWSMIAITFATSLTPIIFPAFYDHYTIGWRLPDTLIVVFRNFILVSVWTIIVRDLLSRQEHHHLASKQKSTANVLAG